MLWLAPIPYDGSTFSPPVWVTPCQPAIGNLFILGFQGLTPPAWLQRMVEQFGLGGVLLFDKDLLSQGGEGNIQNL